jgi:hypothetical protein
LLVELLSSGSDDGRVYAAVALGNLACGNDTITAAVVAAGAIPLMVELLRGGGSVEGRMYAVEALYNLTSLDAGQRQVEELGYTQDQLRELQAEHSPGH